MVNYYDLAMEAIYNLLHDKSVSKEKAIENLQGLIEEIETMIQSLEV